METLLKLCNQIAPLSAALTAYLETTLKRKEVGKRTKLLDEGHTAKYIYFLEKGLVRGFYHDGNKEFTSWLMKEGDF